MMDLSYAITATQPIRRRHISTRHGIGWFVVAALILLLWWFGGG